jgi:gamma-glutamyltranspeptidase
MLETALGFGGAFTAPHRAAALAGRDILNAGGSAIEAMVAAAAMIAVAYPHMNGLGGDAFWIIHRPGEAPLSISGAGRAARLATPQRYADRGYTSIPVRGADAALVVPGAVATWQAALEVLGAKARFTLPELLGEAIALARAGVAVTPILAHTSAAKVAELASIPGFAEIHQPEGHALYAGSRFRQPALAATLERLASVGLDDFYRGDIAATHGSFLADCDSPLRQDDFAPIGPKSARRSACALHRARCTISHHRRRASRPSWRGDVRQAGCGRTGWLRPFARHDRSHQTRL